VAVLKILARALTRASSGGVTRVVDVNVTSEAETKRKKRRSKNKRSETSFLTDPVPIQATIIVVPGLKPLDTYPLYYLSFHVSNKIPCCITNNF
jgi:hypothetical protein